MRQPTRRTDWFSTYFNVKCIQNGCSRHYDISKVEPDVLIVTFCFAFLYNHPQHIILCFLKIYNVPNILEIFQRFFSDFAEIFRSICLIISQSFLFFKPSWRFNEFLYDLRGPLRLLEPSRRILDLFEIFGSLCELLRDLLKILATFLKYSIDLFEIFGRILLSFKDFLNFFESFLKVFNRFMGIYVFMGI